jgi:hypothetical protein
MSLLPRELYDDAAAAAAAANAERRRPYQTQQGPDTEERRARSERESAEAAERQRQAIEDGNERYARWVAAGSPDGEWLDLDAPAHEEATR